MPTKPTTVGQPKIQFTSLVQNKLCQCKPSKRGKPENQSKPTRVGQPKIQFKCEVQNKSC